MYIAECHFHKLESNTWKQPQIDWTTKTIDYLENFSAVECTRYYNFAGFLCQQFQLHFAKAVKERTSELILLWPLLADISLTSIFVSWHFSLCLIFNITRYYLKRQPTLLLGSSSYQFKPPYIKLKTTFLSFLFKCFSSPLGIAKFKYSYSFTHYSFKYPIKTICYKTRNTNEQTANKFTILVATSQLYLAW